jgi:hypothetical protein
MRMGLREIKEVFSQNNQMHKILFQFVHNCRDSRDTNP